MGQKEKKNADKYDSSVFLDSKCTESLWVQDEKASKVSPPPFNFSHVTCWTFSTNLLIPHV